MRRGVRRFTALAAAALVWAVALPQALGNAVVAAPPLSNTLLSTGASPVSTAPTHRLIVRFKDRALRAGAMPDRATEQALGESAGLQVRTLRAMSGGAHVLVLPARLAGARLDALVARLRSNPRVASVTIDQRESAQAIANDPLFPVQWYLQSPATEVVGVNAPAAWDRGPGVAALPATVVAVIDSGVRYDHPDLAGKLLPGYDLIGPNCVVGQFGCDANSQFAVANDGDGRDADASDPGDWVSTSDTLDPNFAGCPVLNSRWHGTRIAGQIGAATNNGLGVAGLHWNARILPVRVLGKCGGYQSDVADGIRWAAGIDVPGVPRNPNPARVINIGVGSPGACADSEYAAAVAEVQARGVVVVASAGNENSTVLRPANCPGVIAVGAVRRDGLRATYSNSGSDIGLMAPGGNFPETLMLASNAGTQGPQAYNAAGYYDGLSGTSFSAPLVSAGAALMLAVAPRLTPTQVTNLLRQSARPFVSVGGFPTCVAGGNGDPNNTTPCNCTTAACGAGLFDADAAMAVALAAPLDNRAPVIAAISDPAVVVGTPVTLTVRAGDPNGDAVTLTALQVPAGASFDAVSGVFNWPAAGPAGSYAFVVRASDGSADSSATVTITVTGAAAAGGGGGGGAAVDGLTLGLLALLVMLAAWGARRRSGPDQPV